VAKLLMAAATESRAKAIVIGRMYRPIAMTMSRVLKAISKFDAKGTFSTEWDIMHLTIATISPTDN
jgi:hypothetical protein